MMNNFQIARRSLIVATAMLITVVSFGHALAETTLERAKKEGSIRVGYITAPPMVYMTPDGVLTGHDPEIAKVILSKLGIAKVDGILTEFSALIPGLKARRLDVIAAGMYINPKRCEEIAFSEPIYRIGEAILIKKGNPKNIKDILNFVNDKSLKLAVGAGSVEVGYAKEAGVDQSQLLIVRDLADGLAAMQSGRADGYANPAILLADVVKKKSADFEVTSPYFEVAGKSVAGYGGFGFRKEDKDLLEAFNNELKVFIGSPEHIALVTPFGFGKQFLPNKTTAELCAAK